MAKITENLAQIQANIERAKSRAHAGKPVQIIAVTKEVDVERTEEAIEAGLIHLGENRPEGITTKREAIKHEAQWHFIGSLQTRKVKQVIHQLDFLHSLDRLSLAEEIEKRADRVIKCFVQANVSGEESKHGLAKDEVVPFIRSLADMTKIEVVGLMTMAPNTDNEQVIRDVFRNLKNLQQEVVALQLPYAPCTELSMGMSNDYEIAVEEGATFVRIGTALVG
ncbi:YggS family pyridoxal phosphate-dependent enzyme [Solibacillus sp. CAU 1738]|uniref:YggS family pyridoxal phosphate-dependent enzyme n=1 Tax=Solibacillus sp. CAU 1738 TaxID=3140363 RepID=UPI0032612E38